jgi:PIN domain nuclease of toxin-antitoxin system
MKYLLDTHVVLWMAENSPMLSDAAKLAILDKHSLKFVSIVSAWEVAIKLTTGKLRLEGGLEEFFRIMDENGLQVLGVERAYLQKIQTLPFFHKDPFDRLLIATAIIENMTLISIDENVPKYEVSWLW